MATSPKPFLNKNAVDPDSASGVFIPLQTDCCIDPQNQKNAKKKSRIATNKEMRLHFLANCRNKEYDLKEQSPIGKKLDNAREFPKRKVIMYFGYLGTKYSGLQFNPNANTIELHLFNALVKSGVVSEANSNDYKKISWARCSRTDKGVHALGQLVSAKILIRDTEENLVEIINKNLPDDVVLYGFDVTQRKFSPKSSCDSRVYEYLFPTFIFQDQYRESSFSKHNREYRITQEKTEKINLILQQFVGFRNFHNYTVQREFEEQACKRYIYSIEATNKIVRNGNEYLIVRLHGNSFMLHQIRKMMAMCVLIVILDKKESKEIIEKSFENVKWNVPLSPPDFLYLKEPIMEHYNKKLELGKSHLGKITFDKYEDKVNKFRETIVDHIDKLEVSASLIMNWIHLLMEHKENIRYFEDFI